MTNKQAIQLLEKAERNVKKIVEATAADSVREYLADHVGDVSYGKYAAWAEEQGLTPTSTYNYQRVVRMNRDKGIRSGSDTTAKQRLTPEGRFRGKSGMISNYRDLENGKEWDELKQMADDWIQSKSTNFWVQQLNSKQGYLAYQRQLQATKPRIKTRDVVVVHGNTDSTVTRYYKGLSAWITVYDGGDCIYTYVLNLAYEWNSDNFYIIDAQIPYVAKTAGFTGSITHRREVFNISFEQCVEKFRNIKAGVERRTRDKLEDCGGSVSDLALKMIDDGAYV